MRMQHRHLPLALFVLSISLGQGLVASSVSAQQEVESVRSTPKDTTLYARPAVIEDYAPPGAEKGVISPLPTVTIVDVVVNNTDPTLTNTDTFNDGETSIAVNPANTNEIVITAFSGGWGTNAVLWHSTDGGTTWTKRSTVPVPPGVSGTAGCPCDQAVDYGRNNLLSGAFLTVSPTDVYSGTTTNPASAASWNWLAPAGVTQRTNNLLAHSFGNVDQPWLLVNRDVTNAAQDNVYVAYDDFSNTDGIDGPDMRIAVSLGANPPNFTRDAQSGNSVGAINPGHRLAVDPRNGFVYSLFQRCAVNCATLAANPKTINYILNRSTNGGQSWSLNGSATGIVAATGDSTQPQPKFGTVNALLGGVHHAAVNPSDGDVYYVYGNRDAATTNNRLAIRRLTDNGAGGLNIGAEHFVTGQVQAAIPSVAVAANGTVGVFHYTFDGFSMTSFPIFTAHLALSDDQGATFADIPLLTFLSSATDNGNTRQRVFGDYMQMKAVGNCFYGAFTGNGVPFGRSFANHDPIFFKTCVAAPDTTIDSGPTAASGGATNNTSATFAFSSTLGGSTFTCSLDNAAFTACASPQIYPKLKVGAHNFKVQATAGGATDPSPANFDWIIDKTAPNTTITLAPGPLTNNSIATIEFTSTEAGGGFQCSLDGGAFVPCTSPFVSSPLADGKHNFQVKAMDAAGNVDKSAAKAKAWTVDTIRPVTTITGKPTDPTTSPNVTFKFKSEKKSTFQCSLDGQPSTLCKSGQKYNGLLPGPHNFQVQATDAALNVELIPQSYSWMQN